MDPLGRAAARRARLVTVAGGSTEEGLGYLGAARVLHAHEQNPAYLGTASTL
jgi:hypothetical protein